MLCQRPVPAAVHSLVLALACLLALVWAPAGARANGGDGMIFTPEDDGRISQFLTAGEVQQSKWSGDAELGYLSVSGNAPALSTHARARIVNDRPGWRHQFRAETVFNEAQDVEPSQLYRASQTTAYKLTPLNYLFEALRYDRNVSQGIRWRWSEVVGYGRQILHEEHLGAQLELGAGARQSRRTDLTSPQREPIGVLIGELNWDITKSTRFNEYAVVESGRSNTQLLSQSGLTMVLAGNVSMRVSYEVAHNSNVPVGVKKTDATSSVSFVYKF